VAALGMAERDAFGFSPQPVLMAVVGIGLLGLIAQTLILHYRGAFNNPAMYLPFTVPILAGLTGISAALIPTPTILTVAALLFWITALVGFVGLGMHLRGFDRQRGGLYVPLFNWLSGPPAVAPGIFSALALIGLAAIHLL